MRYTYGRIKQQRVGNFLIEIDEDYFVINSVSIKINYCFIGEGFSAKQDLK